MVITNLLDVHTRADLYRWFLDHHGSENVCWVRVNRAEKEIPGIVGYIDAVEVALCFGWIDSTQKRIDEGKPIQRFTPRRKDSSWTELNIERCRRLIRLGEMTPAGLAVLPDMDPAHFVYENWVLDALKEDYSVWEKYQRLPELFRRIKVYRIQHYSHTKRPDEAKLALQRFIEDIRQGRMRGSWNDGGRLTDV